MVAAEVDPERLVFVDEMGVHTLLAPLYGYSPKGDRVRLQVPRNRGRNTTLLASINLYALRCEVFGAGVHPHMMPHGPVPLQDGLEAGQMVVMDILSAHKPARVRELIESRDCELTYLPAYSPDFNPIEEAFSPRSRVCCAKQEPARRTLW